MTNNLLDVNLPAVCYADDGASAGVGTGGTLSSPMIMLTPDMVLFGGFMILIVGMMTMLVLMRVKAYVRVTYENVLGRMSGAPRASVTKLDRFDHY